MKTLVLVRYAAAVVSAIFISAAAHADLGQFKATQDCPATISPHKAGNDSGVAVKAGETYQAINLNKAGGDYVHLRLQDAKPNLRWVALSCGELSATGGQSQTDGQSNTNVNNNTPGGSAGKFLLALSWQPAFCESHTGKTECAGATDSRFDATHFTLHGLWPQPNGTFYCGVSQTNKNLDKNNDWTDLPDPQLSQDVLNDLTQVMPGVLSNLQRHEWIKHGTCFGATPDVYFRTAIALIAQVNSSKLRSFIQANIGNPVSAEDIRQQFEQAFGSGSSAALAVQCDKGRSGELISGLSVNLQGQLDPSTTLNSVLDTSAGFKADCNTAVVDSYGNSR